MRLTWFPCLTDLHWQTTTNIVINNVYARAGSIFKDLNSQSPFNFPFCLLSFGFVDSELKVKPGHRHHLPHAIRFLIIRPRNRLKVVSFSNSNVQAIAFAFAKFNTSMALNDRSPNFKKVSKLQLNYLPSPISLFLGFDSGSTSGSTAFTIKNVASSFVSSRSGTTCLWCTV